MEEIKLGIQPDGNVNNLEEINGIWHITKRDKNGNLLEALELKVNDYANKSEMNFRRFLSIFI